MNTWWVTVPLHAVWDMFLFYLTPIHCISLLIYFSHLCFGARSNLASLYLQIQAVTFSLFPQESTLWIGTEKTWSRGWIPFHKSWISSSPTKSSTRRLMKKSELCNPLRSGWGSSTSPWMLEPAKTSSMKSLRKRRNCSLRTSRKMSEYGEGMDFWTKYTVYLNTTCL